MYQPPVGRWAWRGAPRRVCFERPLDPGLLCPNLGPTHCRAERVFLPQYVDKSVRKVFVVYSFLTVFFFLWLPTSWAVICLTPLIWKGRCSSPVPPLAWQKEFEPARTLWRIVTRCSGFKEPLSDSLWRLVFMAFPPKCSHTCGRRQSLHLVPVLPTTIPPFRHLCSLRQEKKRKSSVS